MKCPHCRKEYSDDYDYCPYCAEPKPIRAERPTIAEKVNEKDKNIWLIGVGIAIVVSVIMVIANYGFAFLAEVFIYAFSPSEGPTVVDAEKSFAKAEEVHKMVWSRNHELILWLCAIGVGLLAGLIYVVNWKLKSPRQKMIDVQFDENQLSICPHCGSHSISLGRRGYDWNKAYWNSLWGVKGGRYVAGVDSRRVTAHCNNCGHHWLTDREWIK